MAAVRNRLSRPVFKICIKGNFPSHIWPKPDLNVANIETDAFKEQYREIEETSADWMPLNLTAGLRSGSPLKKRGGVHAYESVSGIEHTCARTSVVKPFQH